MKISALSVLQAGNFVGADSKLGADVNLFPNVTVYPRTEIGARVRIHAGTVVGSDGFGYVLDSGIHRKVPQIGNVVIGDDVEIGANVTIDRGALGSTVIGKGTKIDNLVHVAHNVVIGENALVIACTMIGGSTEIGDNCWVAPAVILRNGIKIGANSTLGMGCNVTKDVPANATVTGSPAMPLDEFKKLLKAQRQLIEK